jgi:ADP-ribosyl-[dinitrogen reductase] hydrolase
MEHRNFARDILFGVAVGDALGVPAEFKRRDILKQNPVTNMIGYGTHNQPPGTWSDDGSLTFCLAESLCQGYDLQDLANRFVNWREHNYWTPHGEVFDIGIATSQALWRLSSMKNRLFSDSTDEQSNGNGSLMRILPLVLHTQNLPIEKRFQCAKEISSITHAHIRSVLCCFIYLEFARQLMRGAEKFEAFEHTRNLTNAFLDANAVAEQTETYRFHRILGNPVGEYEIKPVYECPEHEIASSGYVLHSLEASFWCLLNSDSYKETVLKAVNLGSDTDTTAAIAGGLAGLLYGFANIPESWINQLARREDITDLSERLHQRYISK